MITFGRNSSSSVLPTYFYDHIIRRQSLNYKVRTKTNEPNPRRGRFTINLYRILYLTRKLMTRGSYGLKDRYACKDLSNCTYSLLAALHDQILTYRMRRLKMV